jgi:hypothetical protein
MRPYGEVEAEAVETHPDLGTLVKALLAEALHGMRALILSCGALPAPGRRRAHASRAGRVDATEVWPESCDDALPLLAYGPSRRESIGVEYFHERR